MSYYKDLHYRKVETGKSKGCYRAYMYYTDTEGKRRQTSMITSEKTLKRAKEEAEAWKAKLEEEVQRIGMPLGTRENERTVEEVVRAFLKGQRDGSLTGKIEIESSTYDTQLAHATGRIFPYIGSIGFYSLTFPQVSAWIRALYNDGLSESSVRINVCIVKKVYSYWKERGVIKTNPFDGVKPGQTKIKATYVDGDDLNRLTECLTNRYEIGEQFPTAVLLAVYTGMRRGEICGLRWNCVDFNRWTISVRTAVALNHHGPYTKGPKNASSARDIRLTPQAMGVLQYAYEWQKETYKEEPKGEWFVVGDKDEPMNPQYLSHRLWNFTRQEDLKDHYGNYLHMHSFRHNFATQGIRAGVDVMSVQRAMGHARASMTLDVYATADEQAQLIARDLMNARWQEITGVKYTPIEE